MTPFSFVRKVLEPGLPVLWETILTIYRPSLSWLEGDFTFFTAVGANGLVHFSWAAEVSATPKSAVSHLYFSCRYYSAIFKKFSIV